MATRERPVDRGVEHGRALAMRLGRECRSARRASGLSQHRVAEAASVSRAWLSKFEAERLFNPGLLMVSRVCAVVGLDLTARTFPSETEAIRDVGQARVLARFRTHLHRTVRFQTEVPLPRPGDQRAWDGGVTASDNSWRYGVEVEVHPSDGQATVRRLALKRRDGGMDGVILVLPDTHQTRSFLRDFRPLLAEDFPVRGTLAMRRLAAGDDPGGSSIVVL